MDAGDDVEVCANAAELNAIELAANVATANVAKRMVCVIIEVRTGPHPADGEKTEWRTPEYAMETGRQRITCATRSVASPLEHLA
jgi:hypothetical protein